MKYIGNIYKYVLIVVTAVGIIVSAVCFNCEIYRVVPLFVSLIVMFLQTKASRMSFLIGGFNAAYYSVVYFYLSLYGMALYSLLIACPIQVLTYIRWKKRSFAHSALMRKLTNPQRVFWLIVFIAAWTVLYFALSFAGSEFILLDNTIAVIGAAANLASLLYLIEFPYIQCVTHVLNIVLYLQMIRSDPKQWTFLIYTIYALLCALLSAFYMQKLYNWQKKEGLI